MKNGFQVIAHRGASSLCPENTKSAFIKALAIGVDWIETDLRLTRDGVWVVIHDRDISRHCGQKFKVERMSLTELRRYEYGSWFSEEFRGEPLLTLDEACDLILPSARIILDIKTEGETGNLARSLANALSSRPLDEIVLSSFSLSLLDALRSVNPGFRLGYLFEKKAGPRTRLAGRRQFYSVHPHKSIFTREMAAEARSHNLKTFVWTVNHPMEMRELVENGADGIFTDFPQRSPLIEPLLSIQV